MLVNGSGAQSGPDVLADEFFAQILDVSGGSAGGESLLAGGVEVFPLANVADHGDDFAAVILLKPRNDDGGIESSGVCENDFFRFVQRLIHFSISLSTVLPLFSSQAPGYTPRISPNQG